MTDKKPVKKTSNKPSAARKVPSSKSATSAKPAKKAAAKKEPVATPGAIGSVSYVHDINKKATRLNVLARWFSRRS